MCRAALGNVCNSDSDQLQDQGCTVAREKSAVNFKIRELSCSLLAYIEAALNVASATNDCATTCLGAHDSTRITYTILYYINIIYI